jgi:single-strand DNA-binding protein
MYNRVIMVGNLTRDPELRHTQTGTPVCDLNIAVNTKYGDKEYTCFIGVTVWGKQGESCAEYLTKGRQVLVDGRLDFQQWESDGQKRSKHCITADNVRFLGGGRSEGGAPPESVPDEHSDIEPF